MTFDNHVVSRRLRSKSGVDRQCFFIFLYCNARCSVSISLYLLILDFHFLQEITGFSLMINYIACFYENMINNMRSLDRVGILDNM